MYNTALIEAVLNNPQTVDMGFNPTYQTTSNVPANLSFSPLNPEILQISNLQDYPIVGIEKYNIAHPVSVGAPPSAFNDNLGAVYIPQPNNGPVFSETQPDYSGENSSYTPIGGAPLADSTGGYGKDTGIGSYMPIKKETTKEEEKESGFKKWIMVSAVVVIVIICVAAFGKK
jgi:hypothetical protein